MYKYFASAILTLALTLNVQADDASTGPGRTVIGAVAKSATVQSIDYTTRHVTLVDGEGKAVTLKVGPAAHNFDQVKKGDTVTFDYMEAIALDVRKAEGEPSVEAKVNIERAPKGSTPAGLISETLTVKASVESIDYDTRYLTLKGPEGNQITLKVGEQATRFNEVKKGDHVVVQYTEALAIKVTPKG